MFSIPIIGRKPEPMTIFAHKNNPILLMQNVQSPSERGAWPKVLMILVVSLSGFLVVGPFIGILLASLVYDGGFIELLEALSNPTHHLNIKMPYFIVQGSAAFFGLLVMPMLYVRFVYRQPLNNLFAQGQTNAFSYFITLIIVIFFMGFNSVFIEWNANLTLPSFLSGFEQWARNAEQTAQRLTEFLTTFGSPFQFVAGLIVVAVLAAMGEEFVFRGLLQPALQNATGNIHVAIWVSAFLFSFIHMQFFGLVPRMLLGALFGYLFFWSGNLSIAIFAHFVNNAFSLVAMYLVQLGIIDMDVQSTESAPLLVVICFTLLGIVLLYIFKKDHSNNNSTTLDGFK
jgi:hypothetical protein